jgi:NAD(P)-dependent dehydrogenase (short-subunit alcohol dehydrogenase family)
LAACGIWRDERTVPILSGQNTFAACGRRHLFAVDSGRASMPQPQGAVTIDRGDGWMRASPESGSEVPRGRSHMAAWNTGRIPALTGKRAIVTGANSGLGLETAAALAAAGASVVMACRNAARAQSALDDIRRRVAGARVELMTLDLSSLESVREFAAAYGQRHPQLDILCNNAGVMGLPYQLTRDGFEMQIGTNHLGHFALTGLLLDRLRAAPAARVVSVASIAHRGTRGLNLDDLHWQRETYRKGEGYARSKLANLLFSFELNRRLQAAHSTVISVAAHPGYAATNIVGAASEGSMLKRLAVQIGNIILAQPAKMGAWPTLYAATMPDVHGGDYYGPRGLFEFRGLPRKVGSSRAAQDPGTAARLWRLSEEMTGVRYLPTP